MISGSPAIMSAAGTWQPMGQRSGRRGARARIILGHGCRETKVIVNDSAGSAADRNAGYDSRSAACQRGRNPQGGPVLLAGDTAEDDLRSSPALTPLTNLLTCRIADVAVGTVSR
jgi:hypothetical protein